MKIHEYQAKTILRRYGVAVPQGKVASTVEEAVAAARELGGGICVVKSQIHAGGRGKGRFFGEVPDEFDGIHTIERALRVGSVDRIIAAAELRPFVIDALERGMGAHR